MRTLVRKGSNSKIFVLLMLILILSSSLLPTPLLTVVYANEDQDDRLVDDSPIDERGFSEGIEPDVAERAAGVLSSTLPSRADTFVADSNPTTMFGSEKNLKIKDGKATYDKDAYIKFDLSSVTGTVQSAKVKLLAKVSDTSSTTLETKLNVSGLANDQWDDIASTPLLTPTWNTKFAIPTESLISTTNINGSTFVWYTIDVTNFVKQQYAGDKLVTLGLNQTLKNKGLQVAIKSNDSPNATQKPVLVVKYLPTPTNQAPTISILKPDVNEVVDNQFKIVWSDTDPDNNASVSLYYDNNNSGNDGTLIIGNLPEDPEVTGDEYVWNTTAIPNGVYYVYAKISDGSSERFAYSTGTVTVQHPAQGTRINPVDDTYVWDGSPTTAYGTDTSLKIKDGTSTYERESYLKFDLTPYNTIASAKLNIYAKIAESSATPATTTKIKVYGIDNDDWDDDSATAIMTPTWNTRLAKNNSNSVIGDITGGTNYQWYTVDVTHIVKPQVESGNRISSLLLTQELNDAGLQVLINSSDNSDPDKRVHLVLNATTGPMPEQSQYTFVNILDATKNLIYTSNSIVITAAGNATVSGGTNTKLVKNGVESGTSVSVAVGDTLAIQTASSNAEGVLVNVNFSLGTFNTVWKVQTAALNSLPAVNGEVSGFTQGNFDVDNVGSSTYSIPLSTGISGNGMTPTLSINYSSRGSNGILGAGFSLGGLSTISRCGTTLGQDNSIDPVDFDSNDKFCLDGERLMNLDGQAYGADGTEYRTEHETFTKVISHGNVNGAPAWFEAFTNSGIQIVFGLTSDSKIEAVGTSHVLYWAANKMNDRLGNYLTINYYEDPAGTNFYPTKISYTGNSHESLLTQPTNFLEFIYENRPDTQRKFVGGSVVVVNKRLSSIRSYSTNANVNTLVKEYKFAYKPSSTATLNSYLASITECGFNNSCFKPTTFSWKDFESSQLSFSGNGSGDWSANSVGQTRTITGDFNGDGRTDLAGHQNNSSDLSLWTVSLSNGTSFNNQNWSGVNPNSDMRNFFVGDFNGDGKTDMMRQADQVRANGWRVRLSTGTGFVDQPVGGEYNDNLWTGHGLGYANTITGDFNGDGMTDMAGYQSGNLWTVCYTVIRTTSPLTFDFSCTPNTVSHDGGLSNNILGDFNGDGMLDMMKYAVPTDPSKFRIFLSTGTGFVDSGMWNSPNTSMNLQNTFLGDFNGDGLTDTMGFVSGNKWKVCLSTGTNFDCTDDSLAKPHWTGHGGGTSNNYVGDFNGDGKSDIAGYTGSGGMWDVQLSTGFNFGASGSSSTWFSHAGGAGNNFFGDYNGDGSIDMAAYTQSGSTWSVRLNGISAPNLLTKVVNGHGLEVQVNYKPLTDSSVYTKDNDASYPTRVDFQGPIYVVSDYKVTNGVGGLNQYSFTYGGAEINTRGRGFLGFRWLRKTDNQTGITDYSEFEQVHIFRGMVLKNEVKSSNGTLLSSTVNTLSSLEATRKGTSLVNERYFPYVTNSVTKVFDPLNGSIIKTDRSEFTYDEYGNQTRVVLTTDVDGTQNTYRTTTVNTFNNNASNWIIGRLTRAEVTKEAPELSAQTRVSAFNYDPNTGQLLRETVEPDIPALKYDKKYDYDLFGNIIKSYEMPNTNEVRTQQTIYSTNGRFDLESTNSLGHKTVKTFDAATGNLLTVTDPNGLVVKYEYDVFGRVVKVTQPDGSASRTSYLMCNGSLCPAGAKYFVRVDNNSGQTMNTFYDVINREVRSQTLGFDGRMINIDSTYNNLGQLTKKCEPYFANESTQNCVQFTYDNFGRLTREAYPGDRDKQISYTGLETKVSLMGQETRTLKNVVGLVVKVTDVYSNSVHSKYDNFGNLISTIDPMGNTIYMKYDIRGRQTEINDPDTGVTQYFYNTFSEKTVITDAKNQTSTTTYDKLGRISSIERLEGVVVYEYDIGNKALGKINKITAENGYAENFNYDSLGRTYETIKTIDEVKYVTTKVFDQYSRDKTLIYPSGFAVTNIYNGFGVLSEVKNYKDNSSYWKLDSLNAKGQLLKETLGNGIISNYSYNNVTGYLTNITAGNLANLVGTQNLTYNYDQLGNLLTRKDNIQNVEETFGYDALNRITLAHINGQSVSTSYNSIGNIVNKTDVGNYTYGSKPHAVTQVSGNVNNSYTYDANGNRITSSDGSITYTSFNKVKIISKATVSQTFTYDPSGDLYKNVLNDNGNSTTTVYIGSLYEKVTTGTNSEELHNIFVNGKVIATYTKPKTGTATTKFMLYDHIGSLSIITDQTGALVERLSFDSWGKRRSSNWQSSGTVTSGSKIGFTGHEQLDKVGLINMKGRVYDPVIGRFVSADPFIQEPGMTQSYNRYSYVMNNPLNLTDPSGYLFGGVKDWFEEKADNVVNFVKDNWKAGVAIVVTVVAIATFNIPLASSAGAFAFGFGSSFTGTLLNGGSIGDAFRAGITSGFVSLGTANAFGMVGKYLTDPVSNMIGHGVVGGTKSVIEGGKFEHGFISAALTSRSDYFVENAFPNSLEGRVLMAGAIGGTISELSGGKFVNGAVTAAFGRLYNHEGALGMHKDGYSFWKPTGKSIELRTGVEYKELPQPLSPSSFGKGLVTKLSKIVDSLSILKIEIIVGEYTTYNEYIEMQKYHDPYYSNGKLLWDNAKIVPTGKYHYEPVGKINKVDLYNASRLCVFDVCSSY